MRPGTVSILLPHHIHEIHSDKATPIQLYSCMSGQHHIASSDRNAGLKVLELVRYLHLHIASRSV